MIFKNIYGIEKKASQFSDKSNAIIGEHMQGLKRFDFTKGQHHFSFYYDDVKELINHLVDVADSDGCNLDLMDIFSLVRRLANDTTKVSKSV